MAELKSEHAQLRLQALPVGFHTVSTAFHAEICGVEGPVDKDPVQACLHAWFLKRASEAPSGNSTPWSRSGIASGAAAVLHNVSVGVSKHGLQPGGCEFLLSVRSGRL